MVKNGCDQSVHETQKCTDGIKSFFSNAGTNSGKLKVESTIFGWAWSKMAMAFYFVRLYYLFTLRINL